MFWPLVKKRWSCIVSRLPQTFPVRPMNGFYSLVDAMPTQSRSRIAIGSLCCGDLIAVKREKKLIPFIYCSSTLQPQCRDKRVELTSILTLMSSILNDLWQYPITITKWSPWINLRFKRCCVQFPYPKRRHWSHLGLNISCNVWMPLDGNKCFMCSNHLHLTDNVERSTKIDALAIPNGV